MSNTGHNVLYSIREALGLESTGLGEVADSLIFRRISGNHVNFNSVDKIVHYTDDDTFEEVPVSKIDELTARDIKQNVEFHTSSYRGTTKPARLRDNDNIESPIFFSNARYAEPYFENGKLCLRPERSSVPPRDGDLVCGIVNFVPGKHYPSYKYWFTCSQQFFNLWTLLRYGSEHPSFSVGNYSGWDYLSRSNKLTISNYSKWKRDYEDAGLEMSDALHRKIYHRLRCEKFARDPNHSHVYLAMAVMLSKKEHLSDHNLSKNHYPGYPNNTKWRLPEGFETEFKKQFNVGNLKCAICNEIETGDNVCESCLNATAMEEEFTESAPQKKKLKVEKEELDKIRIDLSKYLGDVEEPTENEIAERWV